MEEDKSWYVLYTRPKWEKKTANQLSKKDIETYCPLHKVVRQWSDRKKTVELPLFTSYVFVYAHRSQLMFIRDTDGVLNFVYWLGKPAIVKDSEIEVVKEFLATHENATAERVEMRIRDNVQILSGPLSSMEGEVVGFRNHMVKVSLPSLGYVLMAEVEKVNIKLIAQYKELQAS